MDFKKEITGAFEGFMKKPVWMKWGVYGLFFGILVSQLYAYVNELNFIVMPLVSLPPILWVASTFFGITMLVSSLFAPILSTAVFYMLVGAILGVIRGRGYITPKNVVGVAVISLMLVVVVQFADIFHVYYHEDTLTMLEGKRYDFLTYQVLDDEVMESVVGLYFIDAAHYTAPVENALEAIGNTNKPFSYGGKPDIKQIMTGSSISALSGLHNNFEVLRSASVRSLYSDDDCSSYDIYRSRLEGTATMHVQPPHKNVRDGRIIWFRCDMGHAGNNHRVACDIFWKRILIETPGCVDSDGGYALKKKGCVTVGNIKHCDECLASGMLKEWYCVQDKTAAYTSINCKNVVGENYVCEDGRCVEKVVTTTTPTTIIPPPTTTAWGITTTTVWGITTTLVKDTTTTTITVTECVEGWTCKDSYRVFQAKDCSEVHKEFCSKGCIGGECSPTLITTTITATTTLPIRCTHGEVKPCILPDGSTGEVSCVYGGWSACVAKYFDGETRACVTASGETGTQTYSGGRWSTCTKTGIPMWMIFAGVGSLIIILLFIVLMKK